MAEPSMQQAGPEVALASGSNRADAPLRVYETADPGDAIRSHYQMQLGKFISECHEFQGGCTVISTQASAPMWNHSAWLGESVNDFARFLQESRHLHARHERRPFVYVLDNSAPPLAEALRSAGFEPVDREAWMFYQPASEITPEHSITESPSELKIVPVCSAQEMEDFIHVFNQAYQIKDAGYADALRQQRPGLPGGEGTLHFVGYSDHLPVCIATLVQTKADACIYNVGTLPQVRRRGYAGVLMKHVLDRSKNQGHRHLFLQVDAGSKTERFYERLGFRVAFGRVGYRLRDWVPAGVEAAQHGREASGATRLRIGPSTSWWERSGETSDEEYALEEAPYPPKLLSALKSFAQSHQLSLETLFIAAWGWLLHRYTAEEKVVFGVRFNAPESLPQKDCVSPISLTIATQATVLPALQTIERIHLRLRQDSLALLHQESRVPAVDSDLESVLDFSSEQDREPSARSLEVRFGPGRKGTLVLSYSRWKFRTQVIRRMTGHLFSLLKHMAMHPEAMVCRLEMLTLPERQQLLVDWNETGFEHQPGLTLQQLFETQVERTPEAVALVLARPGNTPLEEPLTYRQLNRKANRLAHQLRAAGVGSDTFVGICMERSTELIVALLGVLKAGGACVPLDPAYPPDRLAFMIEDTRAPVLLAQRALLANLPATKAQVFCPDEMADSGSPEKEKNPARLARADHVAYVIYTSGSTGQPKGVLITHGAIANHVLDMKKYYELGPADHVLQFSSCNFDAAFEQIFATLTSGARLVVRGPEVWNHKEFNHQLTRQRLTVVDVPTAYWHQLVQEWAARPASVPRSNLRLVIVGGEALLPQTLKFWRQTPLNSVRLVNAYGPTETTITATTFEVGTLPGEIPDRIPIGRPRGARKIYLLDRHMNPVPIGVIGEVYIGGELLARGYLNRPDLTAERFVPNPFSDDSQDRLYRTGDLARFLEDGSLEFLGRTDHQVKMRGFRIELGEIESVLSRHENVSECAVIAREEPNEKRLVAYVVPKVAGTLTSQELRQHLRRMLPEYMVPSDFVVLESLPLMPNGKVDRRALPHPKSGEPKSKQELRNPREPLELQLQLVFERILNRRPIGIDVSFFELGGDSLQALELIVELERATGRNLPLGTLYQASTIETLAQVLKEQSTASDWSALVPLQPAGSRPPFFLIHTTPGDVLGYGNLIYHLGTDQPCYGFQSRGLLRSELCHQRIEQMADDYVQRLREFQPEGPYYLGGWCYGGIV
ncbi:MAG: amino acid adenylation domain-containing protein, partial [Verrucomicrobiota bacterium]